MVVGHAAITCLGRTWIDLGQPHRGASRAFVVIPSLRPTITRSTSAAWSRLRARERTEDPAVGRLGARSIHLALAAARAAWADAGPVASGADRSGSRGGRGRLGVRRHGPARGGGHQGGEAQEPGGQPLPGPRAPDQPGGGASRPAPRLARAERGAGECVRDGGARDRARGDVPPRRGGRPGHLRGVRERVHPADRQRFRHDEGAGAASGPRTGRSPTPARRAAPSASTGRGS